VPARELPRGGPGHAHDPRPHARRGGAEVRPGELDGAGDACEPEAVHVALLRDAAQTDRPRPAQRALAHRRARARDRDRARRRRQHVAQDEDDQGAPLTIARRSELSPTRVIACAACAAAAACAHATAADAPPTRYALPAGELRLSDSRVPAAARRTITFSVRLDRAVARGSLTLTLPRRWTGRSGVSGIGYARLPARGRASSTRVKVARSGSVVTFAFTAARRGDSGSFDVRDVGIPAGTYRLPFAWREGGAVRRRGTARVVFYARTR
jgi:hypothetical protein